MEPCDASPTKATGRNFVCKNSIVLEDNFETDSIKESNWIIEQYIPRAPVGYGFKLLKPLFILCSF